MPVPEELEKGKMIRTKILEQLDKMIPTLGPSVTKKDLATALDIPVANLSYHLAKMHGHGLIKITNPGDSFPDQISWPTPKDALLPDKAAEVQGKEEKPELVQERGEKAEIVQEAPEVRPLITPQELGEIFEKAGYPSPKRDDKVEYLVVEQVEVEQVEVEQSGVRLCKNGDGRPAHKTSPYCLECCRENLQKNAAKAKENPKKQSDFTYRQETFKIILAKFPIWDPNWSTSLTEKWWEIFQKLWDMARELDGVNRSSKIPDEK